MERIIKEKEDIVTDKEDYFDILGSEISSWLIMSSICILWRRICALRSNISLVHF